MNLFKWIVTLTLPACGFSEALGLPTPAMMDITAIVRPVTLNTALAAPAGFKPAPDIVTPSYHLPANTLFGLVRDIAAGQPRTFPAALYADRLQAHFVVRSAVFNFPDLVVVQVWPQGAAFCNLILYSRSLYGASDLGVNRKRVSAWLAELQTKLPPSSER